MEKLKAKEIAKLSGASLVSGDENVVISEVIIDSRQAVNGSMFVALKGESTDGHRFLVNALEGGAKAFLISDMDAALEYGKDIFDRKDVAVLHCRDSFNALQELSGNYLLNLNMRCIAVTGSVGKTTTRDMLYAAVGAKYKAGTNKKNYNSETGLPLTLLSFEKKMEVGVLEMGMDSLGQIARLVEIAEPEAAVITNIGISHIERLGSRENIMKAKMEVTKFFGAENTLVVNWDDDMLSTLNEELLPYKLIKVGSKEECQYRITDIEDRGVGGIAFTLISSQGEERIELPVPGSHNAINCALALAGAKTMGVEIQDAIRGIKNMKMTGSRLNVVRAGGITIIDDSYNAAPASMKSAIDTLSNTEAKRRIAVLGGINELGKQSEKEHRGVGKHLSEKNIDLLITVGEMAKWIGEEGSKTKQVISFETKEDIYPEIKKIFKPGDAVLIKGSRSYELDKLSEEILKEYK